MLALSHPISIVSAPPTKSICAYSTLYSCCVYIGILDSPQHTYTDTLYSFTKHFQWHNKHNRNGVCVACSSLLCLLQQLLWDEMLCFAHNLFRPDKTHSGYAKYFSHSILYTFGRLPPLPAFSGQLCLFQRFRAIYTHYSCDSNQVCNMLFRVLNFPEIYETHSNDDVKCLFSQKIVELMRCMFVVSCYHIW